MPGYFAPSVAGVGVLRLRSCFTSRSGYFAQDDIDPTKNIFLRQRPHNREAFVLLPPAIRSGAVEASSTRFLPLCLAR